MKLYAYCVVEHLDALGAETRGISGATVRLLKVDGLAVVVSDSELDAVAVTREHALAHAAVVRSVLDRTTPLPFRFGTLVTEPQLRSYLTARRGSLEARLAHVRDSVEMSVKIIWQAMSAGPTDDPEPPTQSIQGAGTAFLTEKRRELLGNERRAAEAGEIAGWLAETVTGLTRDQQVTVRPSDKLVLAAAHLVEGGKVGDYREKLAAAREKRPDLHFLVSGPWPPYSFANIELEFETRFGVS